MRRTHLPPGLEAAYQPSHEVANCNDCRSILTDEPVTLDGVRIGRLRLVCPHCDLGRPLTIGARMRQAQAAVPLADMQVRKPEVNLKGRTFEQQSDACRKGWDTRRANKLKQQIRAALRSFYDEHGRGPTFAEMGHEGDGGSIPGIPNASTVRRLFGSVAMAFREAGVPRNPRGDSGHIRPYERRGAGMPRFRHKKGAA